MHEHSTRSGAKNNVVFWAEYAHGLIDKRLLWKKFADALNVEKLTTSTTQNKLFIDMGNTMI